MANRQKAQNMAARGATAKEIRQATGVTAQAARNIVSRAAASSPSPQPSSGPSGPMGAVVAGAQQAVNAIGGKTQPTSVQQINKQNTLNQNLRAASGANGVLSEKELLKISKTSGKTNEKVLEKAVGKGLMIGSKVVNQYQKGKYSSTSPGYDQYLRMIDPSRSSPILDQIRNAGRQDKGSALFIGSKGSTATTLPRKFGLGNNYRPPGTPPPGDPPPGDPPPNDTPPLDTTPLDPILPPEEDTPMDPGAGMLSGGGMGAAGANKLGRAKSRLRQLGIYGRGTGLLNRGLQYGNALNK